MVVRADGGDGAGGRGLHEAMGSGRSLPGAEASGLPQGGGPSAGHWSQSAAYPALGTGSHHPFLAWASAGRGGGADGMEANRASWKKLRPGRV